MALKYEPFWFLRVRKSNDLVSSMINVSVLGNYIKTEVVGYSQAFGFSFAALGKRKSGGSSLSMYASSPVVWAFCS